MKRFLILFLAVAFFLTGCAVQSTTTTTAPVETTVRTTPYPTSSWSREIVTTPDPSENLSGLFALFRYWFFSTESYRHERLYVSADLSGIPSSLRMPLMELIGEFVTGEGYEFLPLTYSQLSDFGYLGTLGEFSEGALYILDDYLYSSEGWVSCAVTVYIGNLGSRGSTLTSTWTDSGWEITGESTFWIS